MSGLRRISSENAPADWIVVEEDDSEQPHSPRHLGTSPEQHELGDCSSLEARESCAKQICDEIDQWQMLLSNYRIRKLEANWPKYPIKIGIGTQFGESEENPYRIVAVFFVRNPTEFDNFLLKFLPRSQSHIKIGCQDKGTTNRYKAGVDFLVLDSRETENSVHALRKTNGYSRDPSQGAIEHLMCTISNLLKRDTRGKLDAAGPYLRGDGGFYTDWVIQTDSWKPRSKSRLVTCMSCLGTERTLIQKRNHSN